MIRKKPWDFRPFCCQIQLRAGNDQGRQFRALNYSRKYKPLFKIHPSTTFNATFLQHFSHSLIGGKAKYYWGIQSHSLRNADPDDSRPVFFPPELELKIALLLPRTTSYYDRPMIKRTKLNSCTVRIATGFSFCFFFGMQQLKTCEQLSYDFTRNP